jgi:endonuclease/exonuclease/phosphatase family metal-dependent hydrolase
MPVVVVGDFNSQTYDPAFEILTQGTADQPPLHDSQPLAASWTVEHNQPTDPDYDLAERIDYIFLAPQPNAWSVEHWAVDWYVYGAGDRYPSDHRAMVARMTAPAM